MLEPLLSLRSFLSSRTSAWHPPRDYSGRAAVLSRERPDAFPAPSHPPPISSVTYSSVLPRQPVCRGRSRTFTGQCCQPFCPGDATCHVDGPRIVTKSRSLEDWIKTSGLRPARELGPPPPPKHDASRTLFTRPLRRRPLPSDAGCVPRPKPSSSEDFRTSLDPPE